MKAKRIPVVTRIKFTAASGGLDDLLENFGKKLKTRRSSTPSSFSWPATALSRAVAWRAEDLRLRGILCYRHQPRDGIPFCVFSRFPDEADAVAGASLIQINAVIHLQNELPEQRGEKAP